MTKIALLTKQLEKMPSGGRGLLNKLNHDALHSLYGDNLILIELPNARLGRVTKKINAFLGQLDGLSPQTTESTLHIIQREGISKIFVDGSNFGSFVALLKRRLPNIEITSFFHNVEARFFWGSLRTKRTLHAAGVMIANYLAEHKAVRWSDKIICLNQRDSDLLKKLYGRCATHIAPMALEDKLPSSFSAQSLPSANQSFALFVGGNFYANQAGITWFVHEVAPKIEMPVCIVGHGFEALRSELEIPGKVKVIGAVENLAEWYGQARFVIAPIFDGSGMKTKVAEALMYGKKVVGTPEAFTGYEDIIDQVGWVCRSADEFITAIASAQQEISTPFDHSLREIYVRRYSMDAARKRLAAILSNT